jgi:hypothetical protein
VLWDEHASGQPQDCEHIDKERITQVWFAGMHSNVGGGYADDALSAVSLTWMTEQVRNQLVFVPHLLAHHTAKADPLGRLYDSRSGLKAYYRYNPRKIEWLTNGQKHEQAFFGKRWPKPSPRVRIDRPKIHESVFTRMSAAPEAYAPIVFPASYAVVMDDGRILDDAANPFESPAAAAQRSAAQEAAWDLVWWRRVAYFAAVAVTLVLLVQPFREGADVIRRSPERGTAGRLVALAGEWLPSLASPWIEYFSGRPWQLFGGVALLLILRRIGSGLQAKICRTMRRIWLNVIPPAVGQVQSLTPHTSRLKSLRSSDVYQGVYAVLRRKVLPNVFGIAILVSLVAVANRGAFEAVNVVGRFCSGGPAVGLTVGESSAPLRLASSEFCSPTGVQLETGKRYQLRFMPRKDSSEPWQDGDVTVEYSAKGFTSRTSGLTALQKGIFAAFVPFRRLWSADWFVPIARIGEGGLDQYRLDRQTMNIDAKTTGELFLFVNDAIWPVNLRPLAWGWNRAFYTNNHGTADVVVTRLPDTP